MRALSTPTEYVSAFHEFLCANGDETNANYMRAYMKDRASFIGIKAPRRRELVKMFLDKHKFFPAEWLTEVVHEMWVAEEREMHHTGMEWVFKHKKAWTKDTIELLEFMITTKSWWDTVDYIAANLVGHYCKKYPEEIAKLNAQWMNSGHLWLLRTALLFQLKFKTETDTDLLFANIRKLADHPDFFIRKGIGWTLRELGKSNPQEVVQFVNASKLSNLSRKEALRRIDL